LFCFSIEKRLNRKGAKDAEVFSLNPFDAVFELRPHHTPLPASPAAEPPPEIN